MSVKGVIFDLDGTLVDSKLDFNAIRTEMGLPDGELILESLQAMPPGPRLDECRAILRRHEVQGANAAELMPGVDDFLQHLQTNSIRTAVLTRNSRHSTDVVMQRLGLEFSIVLTRDDVPAKPDPEGLLRICREWDLPVADVLFVGDFRLDLEAGRNAGMRTVLYAPDERPDYADQADYIIERFSDAAEVLLA